MKKNLVWLASYPKSGNTWFRIFIANLIGKENKPVNINNIKTDAISSSNLIFEKGTGVDPQYLTHDEIDNLRPDSFRYYGKDKDATDLLFIKAHDAYTYLPNGKPLFPSDSSHGAIYIIRNPFDIVVSWAYHNNSTIQEAISQINSHTTYFETKNKYHTQLRQRLLSWKENISTWTTNKNIPTLVLRYEDMKLKPLQTFSKAVHFLGLEYSDTEIQEAIHLSSFTKLKEQEEQNGFRERLLKQESFFRKGIIGDWKNHLTKEETQKIIDFNREILENFGYINGNEIII